MIGSNPPLRLILVGLRGSGKTSAGKLLSNRTGAGFFDTDEWVEEEAGKTIEEIFHTKGEAAFRSLESAALESLQTRPTPEAAATGGGIVESLKNRELMKKLGLVVYLQAPWAVLEKRIRKTPRPRLTNLSPEDEMKTISRKRHPLYMEVAHAIVDVQPCIEEVVEKLVVLWKSLCSLQQKRSVNQ